jgi:riboflavin synthase
VVGLFTGLVEGVGRIDTVELSEDGARLRVSTALAAELSTGDSVALNGACLTVAEADGGWFSAEAMHETLERTSLGGLGAGAVVNVELPLRAGDRLGGHIVQGHVDGLGLVDDVREDGFARRIRIEADPALLRYVVEKGSIAVDGVSLTVTAVDHSSFTVSLIPETLERTTLGNLPQGAKVNLEVDLVAKYVEKMVGAHE